MKTVKFENATIWIWAIVPFKNSLISCDVVVQIYFESSNNFSYDVVEYRNLMNLITNNEMTLENARAAFLAFGLVMDEVIDNEVSVEMTKDVIKKLSVSAIKSVSK